MTRARLGSWVLGVAILVLIVSRSLSAIGPAVIVIYGGDLPAPVVVHPQIGSLIFMWGGGVPFYDERRITAIPNGLDSRRYLSYDVFWGQFSSEELKPEAASEHGRLYLPTADQPAAVVHTQPNMGSTEPGATRADATPIPSQLKEFVAGRELVASETSELVAAGIPMN